MPVTTPGDNASASTTTSGIALTPDGQRVIPSSVRADGTARREIRVRPGYSPPEDVEVYKNRGAVAWKARADGGVPGAVLADDDGKKAGASNKSAKRRAAKLKAKEAEENSHRAGKGQEKDGGKAKGKQQPDELARGPEPSKDGGEDPNAELSKEDKEKQAKSIRKKIRQATDLKSRQDGGEKLLPEQVEKLTKLDKLIQQLNELGVEQ